MVVFFSRRTFIFVGEYLHQYGLIDRIRSVNTFMASSNSAVSYALIEESPFGSPSPEASLM